MVFDYARKQILARATEMDKENWVNHEFFRDN